MKPDICIVVGAPRSGTSMVASVVNRLGWHVGLAIPAPCPPTWRSDFEEVGLAGRLTSGERPDENELVEHIIERIHMAEAVGFTGARILLKSPLLALIWPQLMTALDRMSMTRKVIVTWRQFSEREASLAECPPGLTMDTCQGVVRALQCWVMPDLEIAYRKATEDPIGTVAAIAACLDVDDEESIVEASKLILPALRAYPMPSLDYQPIKV